MGPIAKCGRKCHQSTDLEFDRKRNNKNKRIKNLMNSFKMEVNTGIYINAEGVRIDARDWEFKYDKWIQDVAHNETPGRHPDKFHKYNTHKEFYIVGDEMASTVDNHSSAHGA